MKDMDEFEQTTTTPKTDIIYAISVACCVLFIPYTIGYVCQQVHWEILDVAILTHYTCLHA